VVADKVGGLNAAIAILAALFERERSGHGQRVDVPMLDAYAAFILPDQIAGWTFADLPPNRADVTSIYRTFETRDGHVVGIASQDGQFRGLCKAIEREDLSEDPRFSTIGARFGHLEEFYALLAEEFRKWGTDEIVERARRFGAPFAPVLDFEAFLDDAQVVHNETVMTRVFAGEGTGPIRFLRPPLRFERTEAAIRLPPPRLDEHRVEILTSLGYDEARCAALAESGALG
jgi:crotonobetainyl-CoA:carnitine CoA-transferase CaiB-like acyl-CoA transferase